MTKNIEEHDQNELSKRNNELQRQLLDQQEANRYLQSSYNNLKSLYEKLNSRYDRLFFSAPIAYIIINNNQNILDFNKMAMAFFGNIRKGVTLYEYIVEESLADYETHLNRLRRTTDSVSCHIDIVIDEQINHVKFISIPILYRNTKCYQMTIIDETAEKQNEKEINYLSFHDQLTGLYNRRYLIEEMRRMDHPRNLPIGIIFADLNGLKLVNDAFGHVIGDQLLVETATILKSVCRGNEVIARLGGDEFAILIPNIKSPSLKMLIERLETTTTHIGINDLKLSVAYGSSLKKTMDININSVLKEAEAHMYQKKLFMTANNHQNVINGILSTLHEKHPREEAHSERVSTYMEMLGKAFGFDDSQTIMLKTSGLLHDIGKIALDYSILEQERALTQEEWEAISKHPEIGYRILKSSGAFSEIIDVVLSHHERIDGKGYPRGIKGDEISIEARMLSVCDAFDAMISDRPYRKKMSIEMAIENLIKGKNTQFDGHIVDVFIKNIARKKHTE